MAIGYKEYERFQKGEKLTRKQAMLAQCYICNGGAEGGEDCQGDSCPLYTFMPYNPYKQTSERILTPEHKKKMQEARKR